MSRTALFFNGLPESTFYPGNPNKAGRIACYGWVIRRGKRVLASGYGEVPYDRGATFNVTSYFGLIAGLRELVKVGRTGPFEIYSDAGLVIKQMAGTSSVKPVCRLYQEATELVQQLDEVTWHRVSRKQNREAEDLAWRAYIGAWEAGLLLNTACWSIVS
jgi:ribonuclease HI